MQQSSLAQPYAYRHRELVEPAWQRLPGWRDVTEAEWASAQWQRAHCVKNVAQLRAVYGDLLDDAFYDDLDAALLHEEKRGQLRTRMGMTTANAQDS